MSATRQLTPVSDVAPLLEVSGLSAALGPAKAFERIDLAVRPGEVVALTGEPGAGKTALIRAIAGDLAPNHGRVLIGGAPIRVEPGAAQRAGIAVVWQTPELCDNLDVAANLLLGQETLGMLMSDSRFHATAATILEGLRIPIPDTTRLAGALTSGERQLLAVAAAISRQPRLIMLDEPTAALGAIEAAHVEVLVAALRHQQTAVLVATRDVDQMLRIADRIVVLRHGRLVAELDPTDTHPDDIAALLSGQQVDSSARRQLTRLHGLADSLVSADPSSSLSLILSALGAALHADQACIHIRRGERLECAASLGFGPEPVAAAALGDADDPVARAAAGVERVIELERSWHVPVAGLSGVSGVISVFGAAIGSPQRDDLDLLALYAGYAASAIERDQLLDQMTARNRVLETIREMLQTLAGHLTVAEGLAVALESLRRGLGADEAGLLTRGAADTGGWRAYAGLDGTDPASMSETLRVGSERALADLRINGRAQEFAVSSGRRVLAVAFNAPGGPSYLMATRTGLAVIGEETELIEDAAHSLRLALEREEAGVAHEEAIALRRSRQLQRGFLSRLSHELRTPLTAIRGYATTLRQPDVTWDGESEQRFLERIAAESGRLGRLVDDLLDFSAIESGVMRLQHDWCALDLVVEAAVSCLPSEWADRVEIRCEPDLPPIWADHDRLEQVFVNLLNNALHHNPPGTRVTVGAVERSAEVEITVHDDGLGFPPGLAAAPFEPTRGDRERSRSSGAGLGLSIARGIVDAHLGTIELTDTGEGATFRIRLPIEAADVAVTTDV